MRFQTNIIRTIVIIIIFLIALYFFYNFIRIVGTPGELKCKMAYIFAQPFISLYNPDDLLMDVKKVFTILVITKPLLGYWASVPLYITWQIEREIQNYKRGVYKASETIFVKPLLATYEFGFSIIRTLCEPKTININIKSFTVDCNFLKDKIDEKYFKEFETRYGKCSNTTLFWRKLYLHSLILDKALTTLVEAGMVKTGIDYPHYIFYIINNDGNYALSERDLACLFEMFKHYIKDKYKVKDKYQYDLTYNVYCSYKEAEKATAKEDDLIYSKATIIGDNDKYLLTTIYLGDGKVLISSIEIR